MAKQPKAGWNMLTRWSTGCPLDPSHYLFKELFNRDDASGILRKSGIVCGISGLSFCISQQGDYKIINHKKANPVFLKGSLQKHQKIYLAISCICYKISSTAYFWKENHVFFLLLAARSTFPPIDSWGGRVTSSGRSALCFYTAVSCLCASAAWAFSALYWT